MLFWHGHKRVLKRVALVVLLVPSPYILLGGWIAKDANTEYSQRLPFNSADWKSPDHTNYKRQKYAIRIRMVDDLFTRHKLVGITRKEVIQLLASSDGGHTKGEAFRHWLG